MHWYSQWYFGSLLPETGGMLTSIYYSCYRKVPHATPPQDIQTIPLKPGEGREGGKGIQGKGLVWLFYYPEKWLFLLLNLKFLSVPR